MHGYKWPINSPRTRTASKLEHTETQKAYKELSEARGTLAAENTRLSYLLKPNRSMSVEQVCDWLAENQLKTLSYKFRLKQMDGCVNRKCR